MSEFKRNRYIVAPGYLLEDPGEKVVILSDFRFWNDHYDELCDWCNDHGGTIQGMGLTLPNEHALTLFCLRWA